MLSKTRFPFLRNNFRFQKKIAAAPEMTKKKQQKKQGGAAGGGGVYWLELSRSHMQERLFGDHHNGVQRLLVQYFLHQQEQEQDQEQSTLLLDYDGDDEEEKEEEDEEDEEEEEEEKEEDDHLRRLASFLYNDRSFFTPWSRSRVCNDVPSGEGQLMVFGSDSFFSSQFVRV